MDRDQREYHQDVGSTWLVSCRNSPSPARDIAFVLHVAGRQLEFLPPWWLALGAPVGCFARAGRPPKVRPKVCESSGWQMVLCCGREQSRLSVHPFRHGCSDIPGKQDTARCPCIRSAIRFIALERARNSYHAGNLLIQIRLFKSSHFSTNAGKWLAHENACASFDERSCSPRPDLPGK